jgi:putative membrane-bound dehydrogenase-like protein
MPRARFQIRPIVHAACGIACLAGCGLFARLVDGADDARPGVPTTVKSPVSPQESLALLQVADPRLTVELAAAEPQVVDPIAIAFDEDGRMWVVEMGDYPNGPKPGQPPLSRVRVLEDRDGDGFFETAHTFRDHLLFATGVQPWRGGAIVTLSGCVMWMKDTDGDGKADVEETWFTGFSEGNPQLRANHPTFSPDNRIVIANGLRGGDVISRKAEWPVRAKPLSISGRDFAFDPIRGTYEAISGVGQFGTAIDDFGNRFVCSNRNPCQHVVLDEADIARTPWAAIESVMHDVSPPGDASRVYPLTAAWTTSTLHAGQFTAACGVTIYGGDLLGAAYQGNSFTCEPTGNLVHRDVIQPAGATFNARAAKGGPEFLASRDEWFRPVNLANGPDGALYVVDMYRAVIEHPEWVPDELKHRPAERWGDDRGRIYRVVPKTFRRARGLHQHVPLDRASTADLVALLDNANSFHRETAARLLYERQDQAANRSLERLVSAGASSQGRARALFALDGLRALSPSVILTALVDSDPRVRACAVRLSRHRAPGDPHLRDKLLQMAAHETDRRVRFELVLSLGVADGTALAARLAVADCEDEWARRAAALTLGRSGSNGFADVIRSLSRDEPVLSEAQAVLIEELAEVVGAAPERSVAPESFRALKAALSSDRRQQLGLRESAILLSGFNGLARGIIRRRGSFAPESIGLSQESRHWLTVVAARGAESLECAARRRDAIEALQIAADRSTVPPILLKLATSETVQSVRLAALSALCAFTDPIIGDVVLRDFGAQTPSVRRAILDVLLSDGGRVRLLLDSLEARRIAVAELDQSRVDRLVHDLDTAVQKRARALLDTATPADRKKVIADYRKALELPSDPKRGREVFAKNCTACHRIGELGVNVAPDIGDSRTMTPPQILVDILDPNRKVDNNFFSYTATTKDGRNYTGILATETATSVMLRQQENKTVSLMREQIEDLHSNGVSLMPVGLEKNIDHQQMADLISFIKNWRYLEGRVPLTLPVQK